MMEPQEYPIRHFERMVDLTERLKTLPAQLLEHGYSYESFGSWWSIIRIGGVPLRIVFDGRDGELVVERSVSKKPPYSWEQVSRRTIDAAARDALGTELVDVLRGAADAG
jgi:hypothetical protein